MTSQTRRGDAIYKWERAKTIAQSYIVASLVGALTTAIVAVEYSIWNVWTFAALGLFLLSARMFHGYVRDAEEELHKARMQHWLHVKYKHQGDVNRRAE